MIAIFPELKVFAERQDYEMLAIRAREYFGGDRKTDPRIDIQKVLENLGIAVRYLKNDQIGTLLVRDENGAFDVTMVVVPGLDSRQERFLLAHMLGHYFLDVQPKIIDGQQKFLGYRESMCPAFRFGQGKYNQESLLEQNADAFAAALTMPKGMVMRAFQKLEKPAAVANLFGVMPDCLFQRLEKLMPRPEAKPSNFLAAEERISEKSKPAKVDKVESSPKNPGMDRIRAIARMLDKSV